MASNRQCCPNHEDGPARKRKDCKGGQRMHAGVRQRVHLLHHQRGLRKVSAGEAQDGQWRGYSLCHDFPWLRELLRGTQDLPFQVPRNPPRKSEQATHWAVCSRARWAQRRRPRESTACTEWRCRNARRHHCLWLPSPQRKRSRVLVAPSSVTMDEEGGGVTLLTKASRLLSSQYLNRSGSGKNEEETELRILSLASDWSECASVAYGRWIHLGLWKHGDNRTHTISTRRHHDILSRGNVRTGWIGKEGTRGLRYLFSSSSLDYYWSRFFSFAHTSQTTFVMPLEIVLVQASIVSELHDDFFLLWFYYCSVRVKRYARLYPVADATCLLAMSSLSGISSSCSS